MGLLSGRHSNDPVGSTTAGRDAHGNNGVGEHRYETRSRALFGGRSSGPGTTTGMGTSTNPGIGFGRKHKNNKAPVANPATTDSAGVTPAQPNPVAPGSNPRKSPLQLCC